MPRTESKYGHIRLPHALNRDVKLLAEIHRRSVNMEGITAIETHLEAHRELLKRGPKLQRRTK